MTSLMASTIRLKPTDSVPRLALAQDDTLSLPIEVEAAQDFEILSEPEAPVVEEILPSYRKRLATAK